MDEIVGGDTNQDGVVDEMDGEAAPALFVPPLGGVATTKFTQYDPLLTTTLIHRQYNVPADKKKRGFLEQPAVHALAVMTDFGFLGNPSIQAACNWLGKGMTFEV